MKYEQQLELLTEMYFFVEDQALLVFFQLAYPDEYKE